MLVCLSVLHGLRKTAQQTGRVRGAAAYLCKSTPPVFFFFPTVDMHACIVIKAGHTHGRKRQTKRKVMTAFVHKQVIVVAVSSSHLRRPLSCVSWLLLFSLSLLVTAPIQMALGSRDVDSSYAVAWHLQGANQTGSPNPNCWPLVRYGTRYSGEHVQPMHQPMHQPMLVRIL